MLAEAPSRKSWRAPPAALLLSYVGFVSLGLPDTMLGAVWPAMRADLGLPLDAAGAAVLVGTAGVVLSSVGSGRLRARLGTAAVITGSTVLAASALALGGLAPNWRVLLLAAFLAGLGGGAIDASLNHFVAHRHSARHMNWLHACWGVGATLTPSLVAALLAAGHSWRTAYFLLAAVELALTLAFVATRRQWDADAVPVEATRSASTATAAAYRGSRWASVLMFFFYGGVESGTGLWATSLLTMTRGASAASAGAMVAVYWGALTAGRFVVGAVADRLGPMRVLRVTLRLGLVAAVALAIPGTPLWFATGALALLGFALAPVYPLTMHDTAARFGAAGARLVGYQVASCALGVALIPWLVGIIGARTSPLAMPMVLATLAIFVVALEVGRRRASRGGPCASTRP